MAVAPGPVSIFLFFKILKRSYFNRFHPCASFDGPSFAGTVFKTQEKGNESGKITTFLQLFGDCGFYFGRYFQTM